ncbi:MAG: MaoC family dehydratase N-terminal domain-containing protein [Deltaproteobacteria bacterium]|nr:MaoC family dehydratase N-terminal domain-containing protein [Deltaproteobacteria bacterium]MBT8466995.1 MaoC family dehydratase N-terminal domain-containing protein [Deltaproteobacteria bacterium]NND28147.1 3-alpha,7-alpha,12-alpha-trihydroxy-5-beta-cholest-24-enoyl-CoA hydratase [Myxococcales bacterium]NNK06571.1 3-alpha,7-alpha,12-alpha-trihydroxy-5-beta-cholest-24-enoyl-CoA hydratase [Myxococcales bacterium]NNL35213.1 3-alpha,7-alpha,12-alpha-trihydroxy-5-beta-cholest-24-enoyl-CoA hydrat
MAIDLQTALAAKIPIESNSYGVKDVMLYHEGIGALAPPADPLDPKLLEYVYEKNLKVVPSFGVIPAFPLLFPTLENTPGLNIDPKMVLHGEQETELHRPIPKEAVVEHHSRIPNIYDKGKAALVILEVVTKEKGGDPICTNKFSAFVRGAGGFGGDKGPHAGNKAPDEGAPDYTIETKTSPTQALLYRLTGDMNPMHADPDVAKQGGFPRPLLQGLCTYGIACKAVIDHALDGDVTKVASYGARFAGPIFPGETLVTKVWKMDDKLLISSHSKESKGPVLTNAFMTVK